MAFAVALNLAAPDHWPDLNLGGLLSTHEHTSQAHTGGSHDAAGSHEHSRHCHGDAATCSDVPLTSVGGLAFLGAVLAFGGGALMRGRAARGHTEALTGWARAPWTPPPRTSSLLA